jgi:hypothetical protein
VDLVHAVVGNSDLLSDQLKTRLWLSRNRIIMKIIIAVCLSEMFKISPICG